MHRRVFAIVLSAISALGVPGCSAPVIPNAFRETSGAAERACRPIFYPPRGAVKPRRIVLRGPGLVFGGGGLDVDGEFVWIHDTVVGSHARRDGDLVILRASGDNDYDRYIYRLAPYNSVRTLLLPDCSSPKVLAAAAAIVSASSAVFFAGGDQADYVVWKGTPIQTAVQGVYDEGGIVGGTSAGEAILSEYVFDALHDNRFDATSKNAVRNPYERLISFTYDFLRFPAAAGAVADMHFVTRNRFGRTAVFMARQIADGKVGGTHPEVRAIAVDEASGLVVDRHGMATLLLQGKGGSAFLIRGGAARAIEPGKPFVSGRMTVTKLSRQGERFDLAAWCGSEPTYDVTVDGRRPYGEIYSPLDPYKPPPNSRIPKCKGSSDLSQI
ncbi:MAG: hypothetical protein WCD38_10525 [Candidatus Tumulicola sp.]